MSTAERTRGVAERREAFVREARAAGGVKARVADAIADGRGPARRAGGPSPLLVVAAAFAAGYLLAKIVDWRGYAHPRV